MIVATINVPSLAKVKEAFAKNPMRMAKALSEGLRESAIVLQEQAQIALTTGPTRAIDTGLLRSQTVVREVSDVRASVYPLVHYAIFVHEGTRYMRQRPFFKVAVQKAVPLVEKIFAIKVEKALTP